MATDVSVICNAVANELSHALTEISCPQGLPPAVVLAVSGGLDSMVLLDAYSQVASDLGVRCVVCHVDHGLRESSAYDAQFVRRQAEQRGLPFVIETAPNWDESENLEAWARNIRYRFLEEVRTRSNAVLVLTAHHLDDQAETILLRLLSGRLATDSRSISRFSPSRNLLRPLLGFSREELEGYAKYRELPFVTDETNFCLDRTRNKIRHSLVPLLAKEYNPRVSSTLAEVAARLGMDERHMWEESERCLALAGECSDKVEFLRGLPEALRWRALSLLARRDVGESGAKLGYSRLLDLARQIESLRECDVGFHVRCRVENEHVRFYSAPVKPEQGLLTQRLAIPGDVVCSLGVEGEAYICATVWPCNDPEVEIQRVQAGVDLENCALALFDYDELPKELLTIRARREGEEMRVFGRGTRSIKKLMQEQGVRRELRGVLPIIEQSAVVLWIPGVARSDRAPITAGTKKILSIQYEKRPNMPLTR